MSQQRTTPYYHNLAAAHILGHDAEKTAEALTILRGLPDFTKATFEQVKQVSSALGTPISRLVIDYGLGMDVVTLDELQEEKVV